MIKLIRNMMHENSLLGEQTTSAAEKKNSSWMLNMPVSFRLQSANNQTEISVLN